MKQSPRTNWLAAMAATLFGFGLLFAPQTLTGRIEVYVHDAALPGLRFVNRAEAWAATLPDSIEQLTDDEESDSSVDDESATESLRRRIEELESQVRGLLAENAKLAEQLDSTDADGSAPFVAEPGVPLFVPELLNARVVAVDDVSVAIQRASAQRVVDVGETDGVVPADFVVSAAYEPEQQRRRLIDQGTDAGLNADQPVFAGRCVVGKVHQVGKWTSSILPITDVEYRGRAQLMRRSADELVVGPEGILSGDGEGSCRLRFIAATEPVSIGDEVYTANDGPALPAPMYYGRVTSTKLATGAPYWEITVAPANSLVTARDVQVLRVVLNPSRTTPVRLPEELP